MDLIRKWWWLVLVGVVVGLGLVYFKNLGTAIGGTAVSSGKTQVQSGNKLVAVEKQVTGEVVTWDVNKAELVFKLNNNSGSQKISVYSGKMSIFIPEA